MGKTYRHNLEENKGEIKKENHSKKFYFHDRNNLRLNDELVDILNDLGLNGCVIGGNAVSANYIDHIQRKVKSFDLYSFRDKIKNFSRPTADIDLIIDGEKPKNFEEILLKHFGKMDYKVGKNQQLDIVIDKETPYLSFHFINNEQDSDSEHYKQFVQKSRKLSFNASKKEYSCVVADPIDLVIMKLKSCGERITESKKETDLFDLNILIDTNRFSLSDIKERIIEIGYNKRHENKIKKSLALYVNYVIKNNDEELANKKLEILFKEKANDLESAISGLF